jgi:hypothetical protein
MKIVDDHEVGEAEQVTRFVFGAVLGAVLAIVAMFWLDQAHPLVIAAVFVGLMVGCGLMALFYGDRFWRGLWESDFF